MVRRAFSLIELLVVMAIIALLIGMVLPALAAARNAASSTQCLSQMRQIGLATQLYAQEHNERLPRSTHSALVYREMPWGYALSPYLGQGKYSGPGPRWDALFDGIYRCPQDDRENKWSYGKSVWFELTEAEIYEIDKNFNGQIYPTVLHVPNPSKTVLYGELGSGSMADHIMAHFWYMNGSVEVDVTRHSHASNYVFVDGHAKTIVFEETFNLNENRDLWHPGKAR